MNKLPNCANNILKLDVYPSTARSLAPWRFSHENTQNEEEKRAKRMWKKSEETCWFPEYQKYTRTSGDNANVGSSEEREVEMWNSESSQFILLLWMRGRQTAGKRRGKVFALSVAQKSFFHSLLSLLARLLMFLTWKMRVCVCSLSRKNNILPQTTFFLLLSLEYNFS